MRDLVDASSNKCDGRIQGLFGPVSLRRSVSPRASNLRFAVFSAGRRFLRPRHTVTIEALHLDWDFAMVLTCLQYDLAGVLPSAQEIPEYPST